MRCAVTASFWPASQQIGRKGEARRYRLKNKLKNNDFPMLAIWVVPAAEPQNSSIFLFSSRITASGRNVAEKNDSEFL